jgi:PAS domain S-box-containing protein
MVTPLTMEAAAARYRALFQSAADPILVADENGHYVDANPAALSLLGYTLEELLQLQVSDVSAQAPAVLQDRYADVRRGRGWQGKSVFRRKDGSVFSVEIRASQAVLPEGTLYFAAFRDVTARERVEAQLRESEAHLGAVLEQIPVGIGLTDSMGRWVLANALMGRFVDHGIPSLDPSQMARWRSWDADGRLIEPSQWPGARALSGGTIPGMDFLFTTERGEEHWTRVSAAPFHNEAGEVAGAICVIQDIDARKRAGIALRESEERYRTLVHATATSVWRMSGDGEQLLEVLGGLVQPYDLARGPTAGWLVMYTHPEDQMATLATWRHAVATRSLYDREQRVRSQDGSYRWVQGRAAPVLDEQGEVREWIGTSTDITESKRLEQLRQDVLAIVGHDLRNPLAVISMRAQLMQSRQTYDEAGVEMIRAQTRLMTQLVDELGNAVRLEGGQLELQTEALDLRTVAQEAAERAQAQTERHQIRVEMPETPVIGVWDRVRLGEIVDNLVGNAIKYSPEGGQVLVQVEAVAEEARLRVIDQGTGIAEEALPRVFERFHRADITGIPGLGLGLYIARLLVEAHGGRIQVASAPGEGSTFTVWLPLVSGSELTSAPVAKTPVPRGTTESSIRVLIADDHAMVREGLRLLLTHDPAIEVVGETATGREAVRLAHVLHPDVVLMDLLMPEMDGLTATMAIREELPETQVLVVSGIPGEPRGAEALRAGAIGYLRKDVDAEELRRAVRAAPAGRR